MKPSNTVSVMTLGSGRPAISAVMACSFAAAVLLLNYWRVILALMDEWSVNTQYSYGFLILPISAYLVWSKRERLSEVPKKPSLAAGSVLLGAGLLLLVAGHAGGIIALQQVSLVITLAGLVLLILGWSVFAAVWFPILYLTLAIPVWDLLTQRAHLPFQLLSARIGTSLLQSVGIPSYLDGIYISLPTVTLKVARLCSGVNFLIAVVALGIPMAYLYIDGWVRRIALVISAVVIAILSNGLRVTLVGILAHYRIGNASHGPFHIFQGMFVSVVGFIALLIGTWILANRPPKRAYRKLTTDPGGPVEDFRPFSGSGPYLASFIVAALFLSAAGYAQHRIASNPVPLGKDRTGFPLQLGDWSAVPAPQPAIDLTGIGATDLFSRDFISPEGVVVSIQVAYFDSQSQGREIVSHNTSRFHNDAKIVDIPVPEYGPISVNSLRQQDKNGTREIVFWYDIGGKAITGRYHAKVLTVLGALSTGRTNGSLILLSRKLKNGTSHLEVLEGFFLAAYPEIRRYLPR